MTQDIQPFRNSDLTQTTVRNWLSQQRTGIESGLAVSNGTTNPATSFVINVANGTAWVGSSRVEDDQSYVDLDLSMSAGSDKHYAIVGTYTPAETNPAPSMTFSAVVATPPARPTIPANSVKLADIFVPTAATGISGCTIKNVAKLPPRGDNNGDVIQENLLESNANVLFNGGGTFTYDGGADTLTWTAAIDVVAPATSNEAVFDSAPLAAGQIAAGTIGPAPVVGDNSIFFVVWDRTTLATPGSPTALTMRVLNTDSPDATEAAAFNTTARDQILIIGMTVGGSLRLREGLSGVLPDVVAPADPPPLYLRMDPGGTHAWEEVNDTDLVGGFQIVEWSDATYADAPTALLTELPALQRRTNMVVRTRETTSDTLQEWRYDGAAFVPWQPENARAPLQGVISGLDITKNTTTQEVVVAEGQFYTDGVKVVTHAAKTIDGSILADGAHILHWDDSAGDFTTQAKDSTTIIDLADMPVAVLVVASSVVTKIVDVRRTINARSRPGVLTCGGDGTNWIAEFTHLNQALLHASCFDDGFDHAKRVEVLDGYTFGPESLQGTVSVTNSLTAVTGVGTAFLSDFDAGDFIYVDGDSTYAEVASVASDTSLTLVGGGWPGTTLVTQAYSRDTTRGPHSQTVDFRRGEWGSSIDGLYGVEISGVTSGFTEAGAVVTWGITGETGVAPFIAFEAGAEEPLNFSLRDITLKNNATNDAASDEMAYFVNPCEGFEASRCRFDGGLDMTHLVAWVDSALVPWGGVYSSTTDPYGRRQMFSDCVFINSFPGTSNSALFVDNTPDAGALSVNGHLVFNRCIFDWNETNAPAQLLSIDAQSQTLTTTVLATVDLIDCRMKVLGSLYRVQQSTGTDIHPGHDNLRINIRGGMLAGDAGYDINPITGAGNVFATDLVLDGGTVNLRGMARATGVESINSAAVTLPEQCSAVNCDFETDGTLTLADGGPALIDALAAKLLGGLGIGLAADGTRKSHIIHGCELLPDIVKEGVGVGDNFGPRATMKPGALMFPNGLSHVVTADISFDFHADLITPLKEETIAGTTPTTFPDGTAGVGGSTTTRPIFYVFARKKAGDTAVVLRYDTTKPDAYGRPAAVGGDESTAGYTVNDYAFVGTLMCWDTFGIDCTQSDEDIMYAVWRQGAFVQHAGPGIRTWSVVDAGLSGSLFKEVDSAISLTNGNIGVVNLIDVGARNADIGHCRMGNYSAYMQIFETGADDCTFLIRASDVALKNRVDASATRRDAFVATCSLTGGAGDVMTMSFTNLEVAGTSDVNFNTDVIFFSFTEDRNNLDRQTLHITFPQ